MAAQDKARKNAKERRAKKKADHKAGKPETKSSGRAGKGEVTTAPQGSLPERITKYWRGVLAETRRVAWPSKPELIAGTITSIFILVIFAGWLGGLDYILRRLLG